MKLIKIPKRSGGTRIICVPTPYRKRQCRALIPHLQRIVRRLCDLEVVHGFAEMRSPVTNALKHVGYEYTLTFDLKDFFDSVTVKAAFPLGAPSALRNSDMRPCFHQGIARQGLPTSPVVANIAAAGMDKDITEHITDGGIVYTRYADDLTFSFNDRCGLQGVSIAGWLKKLIPKVVESHGFAVNEQKTRLQWSGVGRRIITGVAVDDTGIYPTRATKRRLRAAIHNAKTGNVKHFPRRQWTKYVKTCKYHGRKPMPKQVWLKRWLHQRVKGLEEWLKLKPPSVGRRSALRIGQAFEPVEVMREMVERHQNKEGS